MSNINPNGTKIGKLFTNTRYIVPKFQRDYSWKKDQIQEFWDDAYEVHQHKISDYFFGPMVLIVKESDSLIQIVDGQQRMTTVAILMSLIRDIVKTQGNTVTSTKIEAYLRSTKLAGTKVYDTITLNTNNQPFFEKFVVKEGIPTDKIDNQKPKNSVDRKIYDAYKILYDRLSEKFDITDSKILAQFLQDMLDAFSVMTITVGSEQDAYRIFATLNQRGLDLTIADLVKNYILEKSAKGDIEKNHNLWNQDVVQVLENRELDVFLKHFWMAHYGYVTPQNLYSEITKKIKTDSDVDDFLKKLVEDAEIYAAIKNPEMSYWGDDNTINSLNELNILRSDSVQPLLIIAKKNWSDKKRFMNLTKACVNIHFRAKSIGDTSAGEMVHKMVEITQKVRTGKFTLDDILKEFGKMDISNDEFEHSVRYDSFSRSEATYILSKIEGHLSGKYNVKKFTDAATLEHILPQTLTKEWKSDFSEEEHEKYLNRIGNLTILHGIPNKKIKNSSFQEKKKTYAQQTDIRITKDLCKEKKWAKREIEGRSEDFAKIVSKIWNL